MPTSRHLLALSMLATLAACGTAGNAAAALNPPAIDTLPGGIVRVKNTGPTAWTDTSGWKLVPTATINPPDGSPGELGDIDNLVLGDDGSVYAFQRKPATIKVYGPDGNYVRSIGREGDGPGEVRVGMLGIHGDTLALQDPNHSRLTLFLTDGTFLRTIPSTCCYYTQSLMVDSAGRVWSPGSVDKEGHGGWLRFPLGSGTPDTVLMPESGGSRTGPDKFWRVDVKSGGNSMSMMMSIPLQPATWQILRSDGAVLVGNTESLSFAVLGNGKDSSRVFLAEAPRIPLSGPERDSVFESVISKQAEQYRDALRKSAKKDDLPATWPAWTNAETDGRNRLWVALPGARGEVTHLMVFDRDGRLMGEVPAPSPRMFKGSSWSRDGLAFLDESDDGHTVIRVFHLATSGAK